MISLRVIVTLLFCCVSFSSTAGEPGFGGPGGEPDIREAKNVIAANIYGTLFLRIVKIDGNNVMREVTFVSYRNKTFEVDIRANYYSLTSPGISTGITQLSAQKYRVNNYITGEQFSFTSSATGDYQNFTPDYSTLEAEDQQLFTDFQSFLDYELKAANTGTKSYRAISIFNPLQALECAIESCGMTTFAAALVPTLQAGLLCGVPAARAADLATTGGLGCRSAFVATALAWSGIAEKCFDKADCGLTEVDNTQVPDDVLGPEDTCTTSSCRNYFGRPTGGYIQMRCLEWTEAWSSSQHYIQCDLWSYIYMP